MTLYGRLYKDLYRAKKSLRWTTVQPSELEDLLLHKTFLFYANRGVSLNNISYRKPTHIYRSDASEFGFGGYNVASGESWRWEIPVNLRLRTSINSLEFIACVITIWLDIIRGVTKKEDCILSQADNMTAAGWLKKSNFADDSDEFIQLSMARKLANLVINSESCIYSQWFSGESNSISDSLSRDFHLNPTHLCSLLYFNFPSQSPFGLNLQPLPKDIVLWVTSLLQSRPQTEPWLKEPQRSNFTRGKDFNSTCGQLELEKIPISTVLI